MTRPVGLGPALLHAVPLVILHIRVSADVEQVERVLQQMAVAALSRPSSSSGDMLQQCSAFGGMCLLRIVMLALEHCLLC